MAFTIGAGAQVYGYANIGTSSPGSTESALIHIRIPRAWYVQNELDPATTAVTHCGDNSTELEVLEVVSSSEDEKFYYFTVRSPGFSEFAVAALPLEMEIQVPVEEVPDDKNDGSDDDVAEQGSRMWMIPVIAAILGGLFFILWKRRKDEDEQE